MNTTLEIACFTLPDTIKAYKAGAEQIEVCDNYTVGGVTPSYGVLNIIRQIIPKTVTLKLMIRPRGGHFVYSEDELKAMILDIELAHKLEFNGVVLGCLTDTHYIHKEQLKTLVQVANPLPVSFHRAFDRCLDWKIALTDIINCGCNYVLTSGLHEHVMHGLEQLKTMKEFVGEALEIMPGGGVRSENLAFFLQELKPNYIHSAAIIHKNQPQIDGSLIDESEINNMLEIIKSSKRAEREGFEPPDLLQSTVFKTAALNRSAISPLQR